MHKSSPLIEESIAAKVARSSKRSSIQRNSNDYQNHPVPNPFRSNPSMLPPGLLEEIGNLEYLTPSQLQKIAWGQAVSVPRRSSVFSRHLEAMQKAAREQQEKMGTPKAKKVCFLEEKYSLSLEDHIQQDFLSQGQRHRWALQPLQMEQLGLPAQEEWCGERPYQYYSMTELYKQSQQWDNYFNVQ